METPKRMDVLSSAAEIKGIDGISLGLMPILISLMKTQSVRKTAKLQGKTPSAISKSLAKLRVSLNDELFIKTNKGLEPSSYLVTIFPKLEQCMQQFSLALKREHFEPRQYNKKIVIACASVFLNRFGFALYKKLTHTAPNAHIALNTWDESTELNIILGSIDVGVHILSDERGKSLYPKNLLTGELNLVMHKDHPATSFSEALTYPFVLFKTKGWNEERFQTIDKFRHLGFDIVSPSEIDDLTLYFNILKQTDSVGLYSDSIIDNDLKSIKLPDQVKITTDLCLYMKSAYRHSEINLWLYELIKETICENQ